MGESLTSLPTGIALRSPLSAPSEEMESHCGLLLDDLMAYFYKYLPETLVFWAWQVYWSFIPRAQEGAAPCARFVWKSPAFSFQGYKAGCQAHRRDTGWPPAVCWEQRRPCPGHPASGQKACSFSWGRLVFVVQNIAVKSGSCSKSGVAIDWSDTESLEMGKVAFFFLLI